MRIGSVPYLNARPLVDFLERTPQPGVTLSYAPPAKLIESLHRGELDIAMASTFAVLRNPGLHLLDGMGVTCKGPAWSVRLLSKVPPSEITTLALDSNSQSTVAMARIVLADRYGVMPICSDLSPDRDRMLANADAAVLIGDIGMTVSGDGLLDLDLGQEWYELTGLPFYFAGWIAHEKGVLDEAAPLLHKALDEGLSRLEELASSEAKRLSCPYERCYEYLSRIMRYRTAQEERRGLEEFRRRGMRMGLL